MENVHARIYKCFFHFPYITVYTGVKGFIGISQRQQHFHFPHPYPTHVKLVLDRKKIPFGCGSSGVSEEGMNCFISLYGHTTSNYCCTLNSPLVLHCLSKVHSPKSSRWVYIQVKQLLHLFF